MRSKEERVKAWQALQERSFQHITDLMNLRKDIEQYASHTFNTEQARAQAERLLFERSKILTRLALETQQMSYVLKIEQIQSQLDELDRSTLKSGGFLGTAIPDFLPDFL